MDSVNPDGWGVYCKMLEILCVIYSRKSQGEYTKVQIEVACKRSSGRTRVLFKSLLQFDELYIKKVCASLMKKQGSEVPRGMSMGSLFTKSGAGLVR